MGVGLAVAAVGMDSIDPTAWTTGQERLEQTVEESVELGSGLALPAAVSLYLLGALERFGRLTPERYGERDERAADRRRDSGVSSDDAGHRTHL